MARSKSFMFVLAAGLAVISRAAPAAPATTPSSVPPGLTLVEVMRELELSQPVYLWTRPGDAMGRTLFVHEGDTPGASTCIAECAVEFPPLLADAGSRGARDWSVIKRSDGALQWAYQQRPLHIWSKEQEPGEVATNVGLTETAGSKLAEGAIRPGSLMPPKGWAVARFTPSSGLVLPDGVTAALVASANGVILTDTAGLSLYAFDGNPKRDGQACPGCDSRWIPLAAPDLALPVGDFSIVTRADGTGQWAYRKKALYRFTGDKLPGDAHGAGIDKKWTLAALTADFQPAGVAVKTMEGYGDALSLDGQTLYGGYVFHKRWGGRNLRDGYRNLYSIGKKLGAAACIGGRCVDEWKPLLAPADAKPHGFWEVYTREDGSRQWAYKGFALFTFTRDRTPADMIGQATYEYAKLGGTDSDRRRVKLLEDLSGDHIYGGAGIYWAVARPN